MTREQAQAVVLLLQDRPRSYRNFGVWWWWVKAELKRAGYTRANLYHLGSYTDPSCSRYYEDATPDEIAAEAFSYQAEAAMIHDCNALATAPDGELYLLHDEDAE